MREPEKIDIVNEPAPSKRMFSGLVISLVLIFFVLYVGGFFAARTDGFRSLVQDRLEQRLGVPVHIAKTKATLGLDLVLEDVESKSNSESQANFRVGEAMLSWSFRDALGRDGSFLKRISLSDCSVLFAPGENGGWEPKALAQLGGWVAQWGSFELPVKRQDQARAADGEREEEARPKKSVLKSDFWERVGLSIADARFTWVDDEGREIAGADGLSLTATTLVVPNRRMTHYYLTLPSAFAPGGKSVRDFAFELLRTGSSDIVLSCTGSWQNGKKEQGGEDER